MYAARRTGLKKEMFGYVPGGYARILDRFAEVLAGEGVEIRTGRAAARIAPDPGGGSGSSDPRRAARRPAETFDQVVVTVPAPVAARICEGLEREDEAARLRGIQYLGIVCASLLLKKPLAGFYVTNITDPGIPFTAVVEMTALVDRAELGGHTLVYLPKYVDPDDPAFGLPDGEIARKLPRRPRTDGPRLRPRRRARLPRLAREARLRPAHPPLLAVAAADDHLGARAPPRQRGAHRPRHPERQRDDPARQPGGGGFHMNNHIIPKKTPLLSSPRTATRPPTGRGTLRRGVFLERSGTHSRLDSESPSPEGSSPRGRVWRGPGGRSGGGSSVSAAQAPHIKWLAAALLLIALAQGLAWRTGEPFYNNDETRHVMTGVFFHDLLLDRPLDRPKDYAVQYYLQYPALGLMVWPPLFHAAEGVVMLAFGPSFTAARGLAGLFSALALIYFFLLVRRTHGAVPAFVATVLLGLSPLVFLLSTRAMLEIPALAFAMAAVFHFVRYLDLERRLDLFVAAAAAAGFALTRYDVLFLLLFFLLALLARRRFDVLRRREVWIAAPLALLIALPVYVPMLAELGRMHFQVTVQGGAGPAAEPGPGLLAFYSKALLLQMGWALLATALAGLVVVVLRPERRRACWPYLALLAATALGFMPLAEREVRHTIYWLPAFAVFAWEAIDGLAGRLRTPRARGALAALLVVALFWTDATGRALYVRGYEEAARYVIANTRASRYAFVDGFLNGDFIYQVRRHDPARRLWVLRGDKLLYGVQSEPRGGYREYAGGQDQILAALHRYDPELLVLENPQVRFKLPGAERLRQTLAAHPDRYERVKSIPIESNVPAFEGVRLDIYRSKVRNPRPERKLSFDVLGLGKPLGAEAPAALP